VYFKGVRRHTVTASCVCLISILRLPLYCHASTKYCGAVTDFELYARKPDRELGFYTGVTLSIICVLAGMTNCVRCFLSSSDAAKPVSATTCPVESRHPLHCDAMFLENNLVRVPVYRMLYAPYLVV